MRSGFLTFLNGVRNSPDPHLRTRWPTLLAALIVTPLFGLLLCALGVLLILITFRVHREVLGMFIGGTFILLGLGTLAFLTVFIAGIDRALGVATPAEQAVLARTMRAADPKLVAPGSNPFPLPYVLRPSAAGTEGSRIGTLILGGGALALGLLWRGQAIMAGLLVLVIVAGLLLLIRRPVTDQIIVDVDGTVRTLGFFRESPRIPVSGLAQVALRRIISFSRSGDDLPRLLLVDRAGRCLLRLNAIGISYEDARQLAAALQVPIDENWNLQRTGGWLGREFPGSTSWMESHPFLTGAIVLGAICAVLAALAWTP